MGVRIIEKYGIGLTEETCVLFPNGRSLIQIIIIKKNNGSLSTRVISIFKDQHVAKHICCCPYRQDP